jgi:hypothetical protein
MVNSCAVCGCCTRTDIVREHLEDTLRICDVSAKGLYPQFFFFRTPTWDFALSAMTRAILCQCSLLPTPFRRVLSSRTDVPRVAPTGPFLRIFPWGGIFWKGTFLWDNILEGDSNGWRPRVWPIYYAWMGGVWGSTPPENFWNLNPGNVISCILSIQICSKIYANSTCIWNE